MKWFRWSRHQGGSGASTALIEAPPPPRPSGVPPEAPQAEINHLGLTPEQRAVLKLLYGDVDRPLDSLPYTEEFEGLYGQFLLKTGLNISRHSVWRALVGLRKASKLRRTDGEVA